MAATGGGAASAVGRFGMFLTGPWGAAIGVATLALGGLVGMLGNSAQASESAKSYQQQLAGALKESKGAIDDTVRALAAQKAVDEKLGDSSLLEVAQDLGVSLPRVTDALLGIKGGYEEAIAGADAYAQAALDAASGNTEDLGFQAALEKSQAFKAALADLAPSVGAAVAENERLAAAQAESGDAAAGSTPKVAGAAEATEDLAESGEDAVDAAENLAKALDALNGPALNVRDATRGYQAALDGVAAALAENGRNLDINTEAGRNNAEALDGVATSALEQAEAIYNSTGSYDAFRTSLEEARGSLFDQATAFGMTDEEARKYVDTVLQIPDEAATGLELQNYDRTRDQLIDVFNRVRNIPPGKTVNMQALTVEATEQLRQLGIKVQSMPDGTVNVSADTAAAVRDLDAFLSRPATKTVKIITDSSGASIGADFANGLRARASGGPVWPGEPFLVGEKGPEIVTFPANGHVTPADQTARILGSMRQPAAAVAPPMPVGAGSYGGGSVSTSYARTYAPQITIASSRPLTARQVLDAARDDEYLHGPR